MRSNLASSADQRFDVNDPRLTRFGAAVDNLLHSVTKPLILDFFPWIRSILPKFIVDKVFMKEHKDATESLYHLFQVS